jgi:hypothetical protein
MQFQKFRITATIQLLSTSKSYPTSISWHKTISHRWHSFLLLSFPILIWKHKQHMLQMQLLKDLKWKFHLFRSKLMNFFVLSVIFPHSFYALTYVVMQRCKMLYRLCWFVVNGKKYFLINWKAQIFSVSFGFFLK